MYRKETFSGVYTDFTSFIPLEYNFGLSYTLLHWSLCLVLNFSKFHLELEKFKKILSKNVYSQKFIDDCIFKFLNRTFELKSKVTTVPKKELGIVLSYLGNIKII